MPRVAYTVVAHLPTADLARSYIAWLRDGHVNAVIAGGAQSATIVLIDPETLQGPRRVEVRYIFASRDALDQYVHRVAPALRAEGLARFGPATGTQFSRSSGEIHE